MNATTKIFALALLVLAGATGACTPASPGTPSFQRDVRPIFLANCVRCHGAGGMLRTEADASVFQGRPPRYCYLDVYDDPVACPDGGVTPDCQPGAHTCATGLSAFFTAYLHPAMGPPLMPPAPSEPLNEWELDVVDRWLANPIP